MPTVKEILSNGVKIDDKFVDDSISSAINAATERINGNINNDEYKKKIEEIKKNIEAKKQQEKKIALIKASQGVKVGSDSVGSGVSTQVQNPV